MNTIGKTFALPARILVPGEGAARLLRLEAPLSFWGGVNPGTGEVVDPQHPQAGVTLRGAAVALPGLRGSTAGPGALLECLAAGTAPAALLLPRDVTAPLVAGFVGQFLGTPGLPLASLDPGFSLDRLVSGSRLIMAGADWRVQES